MENGCTYNGQLYFDVSAVPSGAAIQSATLRVYTPAQTSATGVQVYQNVTPTLGADPSQPPSWSGAPAIVTGTTPITQGGSDGHWQSWDMTSLVRQWAQDTSSNGGMTLASAGTPVRFASPFGAGTSDPSLTPYLDIVYAPGVTGTTTVASMAATASSTSGPYNDTATTIFGESGNLTFQGDAGLADCTTPHNDVTCPDYANGAKGGGQFKSRAVRYKLAGKFVRFPVSLACQHYSQDGINPYVPGRAWWNTSPENPLKDSSGNPVPGLVGTPASASPFNIGDPGSLLTAAKAYGIIPVINLVPNGTCAAEMTPRIWYDQAQDFVSYLYSIVGSGMPMVYFEVGNEPNVGVKSYTNGPTFDGLDAEDQGNTSAITNTYHYDDVFAAAAHGLQAGMASGVPSGSMYRILTAGMFDPAATMKTGPGTPCKAGLDNNGSTAILATRVIAGAEQSTSSQKAQLFNIPTGPTVPASHLGLGIHPYGFTTRDRGYWRNYFRNGGKPEKNPCRDLGGVIKRWSAIPGNLPIVFTEEDYDPGGTPYDPLGNPTDTNPEGAFLVDLFTWLYGHDAQYHVRTPSASRLRVPWSTGVDKPAAPYFTGLYTQNGSPKTMTKGLICHNPAIKSGMSLAQIYYYLNKTRRGCY